MSALDDAIFRFRRAAFTRAIRTRGINTSDFDLEAALRTLNDQTLWQTLENHDRQKRRPQTSFLHRLWSGLTLRR